MKKECEKCTKQQPAWAFKESNICIFCDPNSVEIKAKENREYEEVEDKGCAGGACTL